MDAGITASSPGETCRGCGMSPIWLQRPLKCNICSDYYLCEGCYIGLDIHQLPSPHSKDHVMTVVVISSSEHCGLCGLHRSRTQQRRYFDVFPNFFMCEDCFQGLDAHLLSQLPSQLISVEVRRANCDGCGSCPILTQRWHCKVCPDFDLCEVCYKEIFVKELIPRDANRCHMAHTRDHPMFAIAVNNMGLLGLDWREPLFPKPHDLRWSYGATEESCGFQWRRWPEPLIGASSRWQHGDIAPGPILRANATSILSDTSEDVVHPMLFERLYGMEVVGSGSSSTAPDEGTNGSRNSWSLTPQHKVFLSHAGPQKDFVEQLCKDLKGYHEFGVFFDKDEGCLPKGEEFPKLILQAARQCELAVVVMSEDYFTRKWPMMELVAFVEAKKTRPGLKILPLYYKLSVEEFKEEERQLQWVNEWKQLALKDPRIDVQQWKEALKIIPPINGIPFVIGNGEVAYREEIVRAIWKSVPPYIRSDDSHVQGKVRMSGVILKELGVCNDPLLSKAPHFAGMYGMGGKGKTTLCKLVRDDLFQTFGGKVCHVELGSKSPLDLQKQVLRQLTDLQKDVIKILVTDASKGRSFLKARMPLQKVFLAVDNVWDTLESVEEATAYLTVPFKKGSVVLVTARTKDILEKLRLDWQTCFEVPGLQKEEATTLFVQHTGCMSKLSDVEEVQVREFVKQCCFIEGRNDIGQYHPLALKVLGSRVGSDSSMWKDIVIDFKDMDCERKNPIFSVLRSGYNGLSDKHQKMFLDVVGYAISFQYPGEQFVGDIEKLLDCLYNVNSASVGEFLRLLQTKSLVERSSTSRYVRIHDLYYEFVKNEVQVRGFEHKRKCRLYAQGNAQTFQSGRLDVHCAEFTSLAKKNLCGCADSEMLLVRECKNLTELDVQGMDELTILEIYNCDKLTKLSIKGINTLKSLTWRSCTTEFPSLEGLLSLKHLELQGIHSGGEYSQIPQPPDFLPCANLETLELRGYSHWGELPQLGLLKKLEVLKIISCSNIRELTGLDGLSLLKTLDLRELSLLKEIPHMGCFPLLQYLYLDKCDSISGISGLDDLTLLRSLWLRGCIHVTMLPNLGKLTKLEYLIVSDTGIEELLGLEHLLEVRYIDCTNTKLSGLPGVDHCLQLECLDCSRTNLTGLPDLSNLHKLQNLIVRGCSALQKLDNIGKLPTLERLGVSGCPNLVELPDLSDSIFLTELDLSSSPLVDPNLVKVFDCYSHHRSSRDEVHP